MESRMTKPILLAGLLGGLLGGAASFAANRWIKPPEPAKADSSAATGGPSTAEAKNVADGFVAKLKAGKIDEFSVDVKNGAVTTDEEFKKFKERLEVFRATTIRNFGMPTGEFEMLRETTLSPSLSRFVYLEKLERGAMWWTFVIYRGKDNWKLSYVDFGWNLGALFGNFS